MIYTASFIKEIEGNYRVVFNDLPGCVTSGDTFEEAYKMAIDTLAHWMADQEKEYPATPFEKLAAEAGAGERLVAIQLDAKLMEGYSTTASVNISLSSRNLHKIDTYISKKGGDRSKLMTAATLDYMDQHS